MNFAEGGGVQARRFIALWFGFLDRDEGNGRLLASFGDVDGVADGVGGNGQIEKAIVAGEGANGAVGLEGTEVALGAFVGALMGLAVALVAFEEREFGGVEEGVGVSLEIGFGAGDFVEGPGGLEELAEPVFFGGADGDVFDAAGGFEEFEFGLILGGDAEGLGAEAVAGGVLGRDDFAAVGAGSGRELRVGLVGGDFVGRSHG